MSEESEAAQIMRGRILDIVIDVMAERAGGHTKFINQRDGNFLPSAYKEFSYWKGFTNALNHKLRDYIQTVPESDFECFF